MTITETRYSGVYEGGKWAAFDLWHDEIPDEAFGDDTECAAWWEDYGDGVGTGDTTPELVYIGSKTGYYMPVPWSEQDSFDAHDKDTPTLKGVYFVQAEDSGMVKVGWSTNVYRRMHALQTGSPSRLRLLGVLDVDQAVERIIHVQYGHLRAHGEWFHPQVTEALHAHPRAA